MVASRAACARAETARVARKKKARNKVTVFRIMYLRASCRESSASMLFHPLCTVKKGSAPRLKCERDGVMRVTRSRVGRSADCLSNNFCQVIGLSIDMTLLFAFDHHAREVFGPRVANEQPPFALQFGFELRDGGLDRRQR